MRKALCTIALCLALGLDCAASPVSHLLTSSSPFAILRRIGAVVVDSLYRPFRVWSAAHICNESLVTFKPSRADTYSTTAIIFPALIAWIGAALNHRIPYRVFSGAATDNPRIAVRSIAFAFLPILSQASTTFCVPSEQRFDIHRDIVPALAMAGPCRSESRRFTSSPADQAKYFEQAETLSCKVTEWPLFVGADFTAKFSVSKGTTEHVATV